MPTIAVREATLSDVKGVLHLIKELAMYEKMPECAKLTEEDWINDGFGDHRFFYTFVAVEIDEQNGSEGQLVGLALYFYTYSTWEGRSALLEDIFVKPEYRHKGVGHQLLTAVVKTVYAKRCSRLDLHVLDWNAPSLQFFKQHGAIDLTEKEGWHFLRLTKNSLSELDASLKN
ncbi:hypothetical protein CHUAL_000916 [Chamberlinius hualienensis]